MKMRAMRVTIKDVAREADLAVGTVSNYINGKNSVKKENKERIEKAIAALGYQVDEIARNLKTKSSKTIGVIIPSFGNVFAVKTVSHLEMILRKSGYALQVSSYNSDSETLNEIINAMVSKHADGLLIMPSIAMSETEVKRINSLLERKIPVVVFDSTDDGVICDHIVLNNYDVVKSVTNILFEMGHRKIALILGPTDISSSKERLNAYIDAHNQNGNMIDEKHIIHTDYTKRESQIKCGDLLDNNSDISAVLTAGYRITLGVLASINERKLNIPNDISVIGFDSLDINDILPNHLTGVYIPTDKVAKEIANVILSRIEDGFEEPAYKKVIELGFVIGKSVKQF